MSIEAALEKLTEAVKENTQTLLNIGKAARASTTSASAEKPATAAKASTTSKPKAPTAETIQKRFGEYLNVSDKDERKERTANVIKLNKHFGVAKMTEADASDWPKALEMLKVLEDGGDPFEDEGEGAEDGESLV